MRKLTKFYKKLNELLFPQLISHEGKYTTFQVEVSGLKLNCAKVGRGQPLVFIHGWANNWEGWIPIIKYLKDTFTLYLVDLPGFGDSDDLNKYSVETQARYVSLFINTLPQKPISVIGLSMGTFVVADLVYKYPQDTRSGILIGPVLKDGNTSVMTSFIKIFLESVSKSFISETALKKIVETRMAAYAISKYVNMYKFRRKLVDSYGTIGKKKMRKEAFVQMGISVASYNLREVLTKVTLPTLLIYGKQDKVTSYKFPQKNLLSHNPNLSCTVISKAGHVVPWEKPKEVAESIKKFIAKNGIIYTDDEQPT